MAIFTGRKLIQPTTPFIVTDKWVLDILANTMATASLNKSQITFLDSYYRGNQPIWQRKKKVRRDICNKIVENRAYEIVQFYLSYRSSYPTAYVAACDDVNGDALCEFNKYLNKRSIQRVEAELVEWQEICGTAFAFVQPERDGFSVSVVDPRHSYIVYNNAIVPQPIMAVLESNDDTQYIYTDNTYYVIKEGNIVEEDVNRLGRLPLIEFPLNRARLSRFEPVIPLLDALNTLDSNRLDGVEQTIQSFLKFLNCNVTLEQYEEFLERGAIKVNSNGKNKADVEYVKVDLDQTHAQTLKTDLINSIITITGIPNRNGGSSTSDTGAAVEMRDGWQAANFQAKQSEVIFADSMKQVLDLCLNIAHKQGLFEKLSIDDIALQFTRRNYDNIQTKSQVLTSMLASDKIHPLLAFRHCGMFPDPDEAYSMSKEYIDREVSKTQETTIDREVDKTQIQ